MTKFEEFETLKANVLKEYVAYVNNIKALSYEDLQNLQKVIDSTSTYSGFVSGNIKYRKFINSFRRAMHETNNFKSKHS